MNIWLALSIYLTLFTMGVIAGGAAGAAIAPAIGAPADLAWLAGAFAGGGLGLLLGQRVIVSSQGSSSW